MSEFRDYIIALSTDQTSNHRQIMERLPDIEERLDFLTHRMVEHEKNSHERGIFLQGIVMGVRSLIEARFNRIEKLLIEHHGSAAPPLDLGGMPDDGHQD